MVAANAPRRQRLLSIMDQKNLSVVVTLDEKGNQDPDSTIKRLVDAGFTHSRTLDFGNVFIVFGLATDGLDNLKSV